MWIVLTVTTPTTHPTPINCSLTVVFLVHVWSGLHFSGDGQNGSVINLRQTLSKVSISVEGGDFPLERAWLLSLILPVFTVQKVYIIVLKWVSFVLYVMKVHNWLCSWGVAQILYCCHVEGPLKVSAGLQSCLHMPIFLFASLCEPQLKTFPSLFIKVCVKKHVMFRCALLLLKSHK